MAVVGKAEGSTSAYLSILVYPTNTRSWLFLAFRTASSMLRNTSGFQLTHISPALQPYRAMNDLIQMLAFQHIHCVLFITIRFWEGTDGVAETTRECRTPMASAVAGDCVIRGRWCSRHIYDSRADDAAIRDQNSNAHDRGFFLQIAGHLVEKRWEATLDKQQCEYTHVNRLYERSSVLLAVVFPIFGDHKDNES